MTGTAQTIAFVAYSQQLNCDRLRAAGACSTLQATQINICCHVQDHQAATAHSIEIVSGEGCARVVEGCAPGAP